MSIFLKINNPSVYSSLSGNGAPSQISQARIIIFVFNSYYTWGIVSGPLSLSRQLKLCPSRNMVLFDFECKYKNRIWMKPVLSRHIKMVWNGLHLFFKKNWGPPLQTFKKGTLPPAKKIGGIKILRISRDQANCIPKSKNL